MSYVNTGAFVDGERPLTKKALKEAIKNQPQKVMFDPTSAFDRQAYVRADWIPNGVALCVCGPDPYTLRKWYATVTTVNGNVKVT